MTIIKTPNYPTIASCDACNPCYIKLTTMKFGIQTPSGVQTLSHHYFTFNCNMIKVQTHHEELKQKKTSHQWIDRLNQKYMYIELNLTQRSKSAVLKGRKLSRLRPTYYQVHSDKMEIIFPFLFCIKKKTKKFSGFRHLTIC